MDFMTDKPGVYNNLLVIMDRFSGNYILCPIKSIDVGQVVKKFYKCVWSHYRPPDSIVSDRGP